MKLKKVLALTGFLTIVLFFTIYYFFHKEQFQLTKNKEDPMYIIDKFCNKQFGDDWGVDSVYHYNDKIIFVVVHTKNVVIDLSIQPENRAIIIENIRGETILKKRVHRF